MPKPKKQAPRPEAPRGRHTTAEPVDWLRTLDRRRKLARVARCEAACTEILAQPDTDPRRRYVARMQALLATARGNLERGHHADWQMAQIEALGSRMNRAFLEPLAAHGKAMTGRRVGSYSALRRMLEAYEAAHPGAAFPGVWEHLGGLADGDDKTIQEVLDLSSTCHPGLHVHWLDAQGRERSTSAEAIKKLLRKIRRARHTAPATPA
jgi:cellobiose-specific phosphotransferase system component IIA